VETMLPRRTPCPLPSKRRRPDRLGPTLRPAGIRPPLETAQRSGCRTSFIFLSWRWLIVHFVRCARTSGHDGRFGMLTPHRST